MTDTDASKVRASSVVKAADMTKPQSLAVAKWTYDFGKPEIKCIYYSDRQMTDGDDTTHALTLCSDRPLESFAGDYRLTADGKDYDISVSSYGETGFAITAAVAGEPAAQGLGLIDPFDQNSLMISWWYGEVKPYGIVKYSIQDANTIRAYYISEMSPEVPGGGKAIGDTSNGFPGTYSLTYEERDGTLWGPFDWTLEARGDMIDVTWRQDSKNISRGFGFVDPKGPPAIIVNYFVVRD